MNTNDARYSDFDDVDSFDKKYQYDELKGKRVNK